MNIGNFEPKKKLTVQITLLSRLNVFDKSWMLSLTPTFTPRQLLNNAGTTLNNRATTDEEVK